MHKVLFCCSGGPVEAKTVPLKSFKYVVLGGGNAAGYACREFVAQGVSPGDVGVICGEMVAPYERPALTKAYLHPPEAKVRARLPGFHTCVGGGGERQTPEWYVEKGIELVPGIGLEVDLESRIVKMNDGGCVNYEKLIVATGLQARKLNLPGANLDNVFYLREEADAAALVSKMETLHGEPRKAVILGGGFIGAECAAALCGWGFEVTVIMQEDHLLSRLFNRELAGWFEHQYMAKGIRFIRNECVSELASTSCDNDSTSALTVKLQSGISFEADFVVVGAGASANLEVFKGLDTECGGLKVDAFMKTSNPNVFAIGDIATFPSSYGGQLCRQEHVAHARLSAVVGVRSAMSIQQEPYNYLPYYYSRVFEYTERPVVFNFFGLHSNDAKCNVFAVSSTSMAAAWIVDDQVVGALLMGTPGPSQEDTRKLREIVESKVDAANVVSLMQTLLN